MELGQTLTVAELQQLLGGLHLLGRGNKGQLLKQLGKACREGGPASEVSATSLELTPEQPAHACSARAEVGMSPPPFWHPLSTPLSNSRPDSAFGGDLRHRYPMLTPMLHAA